MFVINDFLKNATLTPITMFITWALRCTEIELEYDESCHPNRLCSKKPCSSPFLAPYFICQAALGCPGGFEFLAVPSSPFLGHCPGQGFSLLPSSGRPCSPWLMWMSVKCLLDFFLFPKQCNSSLLFLLFSFLAVFHTLSPAQSITVELVTHLLQQSYFSLSSVPDCLNEDPFWGQPSGSCVFIPKVSCEEVYASDFVHLNPVMGRVSGLPSFPHRSHRSFRKSPLLRTH